MNSKKPHFCSSFSLIHVLLYALVLFLTSPTILGGNETDYQALLNIKSMITKDPYGFLSSWNNSHHFCEWAGVICGKRHKRVTYLELRAQGLEGSLTPHIGNLSFLRGLVLRNNSFHGTIPNELGRLSRLRILLLSFNKFKGVIPVNISSCSKLQYISLSGNKLVGSIPKEISSLSELMILSLHDNKLIGGIPPSVGNLTSMVAFSVAGNPLGGSIPHTLGHCKSLQIFYSGGCNLNGVIPDSFYNLSLLVNFSMSGNQLTGGLHQAIGEMLPHLVGIQVYGNHLTGPLPQSLSNCTGLRYLEVSDNKFSGKLALNFEKLREIKIVLLHGNLFGSEEADEMKFIDSLTNNTSLEKLSIGYCKFQGVIPRSIGNLSNQLDELLLNDNRLQGNLPKTIGNLVSLRRLYLYGNRLTGNIPSSIGKLQNLEELLLHDNQFSGQIPNTIGNLSILIYLYLHLNRLQGNIPSSMGNCHNLLELHLDNNCLNGEIPSQILQLTSLSIGLGLSRNNLSGSLPTEVGDLKSLDYLDLSDNSLSGNIPNSLGGCSSLSFLFLQGNWFQGMIPPSLSSLKGLTVLDISHNKLCGQIPQFLERFSLENLNLSYNDFEGEVPMQGVFANASAFSVVGNTRLCGGSVELGLKKCKETKKDTKKFPLFVIVTLIVFTILSIVCIAYACCKKRRKRSPTQSLVSNKRMIVSYNQLLKATNGFSDDNLIGKGGFSSVYKGVLDENDDRFVAIKILHLQNQGAQRSFMRECEALRNIRHRNIIKIITSCSSIDFQGNDFKALVYEFLSNGSLHDWLHLNKTTTKLNLLQIINILVDVASALDYMHNQCIPNIGHGDLKPSNILLDNDMVAQVGDFGLARFLGTSYPNSSTGIRGTTGYAAPEYGLGNGITSSGDVYSFGILTLEMMTGKKPTDAIFCEGLNLHKFASMAFPDHVMDAIDVSILKVYQEDETFIQNKEENVKKIEECLASIVNIGLLCAVDSPAERMDMKNVINELKHILDTVQKI